MKIITISNHKGTMSESYKWIIKKEYSLEKTWTLNVPIWIIKEIEKFSAARTRTRFIIDAIEEYLRFLKSTFETPKETFLSRSEFVRHAILHKIYKLNHLKTKEIDDNIEILKILEIDPNCNTDFTPKTKRKGLPWDYEKPKEFVPFLRRHFSARLIVSHLNERGELSALELSSLIGQHHGYIAQLIRSINEKFPELISKHKIRKKNTRKMNYHSINQTVFEEVMKNV